MKGSQVFLIYLKELNFLICFQLFDIEILLLRVLFSDTQGE